MLGRLLRWLEHLPLTQDVAASREVALSWFVSLLSRLHNSKQRMSVDVLEWEIDEMCLRVNAHDMGVRHVELAERP